MVGHLDKKNDVFGVFGGLLGTFWIFWDTQKMRLGLTDAMALTICR